MARFGKGSQRPPGEEIIAVGVQDTYVDSGIGVAQVSWSDPERPGRQQSGLVQVSIRGDSSLGRLLHRTLHVRRRDIQDAATRFDLDT